MRLNPKVNRTTFNYRFNLTFSRTVLAGVAVIALLATGCGASKITEEQLSQIRELRKQQTALNDKIKATQGDIARLESEIADRQKAVNKCKEDKAAVEQRLAQWPNVWPDAASSADSTKTTPKKSK